MLNIIKNSFNIVIKNYTITLFFVLCLILVSLVSTRLNSMPTILGFCTIIGLFFFICAFFAGWFGMIKVAIENSYQEKTKEEELKDILSLKGEFLNFVGSHIFPMILTFILYSILLIVYFNVVVALADKFVGNIDFLYNDTKNILNSESQLVQYFSTLPKEKITLIFAWQLVLILSVFVFNLFTLLWVPALFLNKSNSKNSFKAFLSSLSVIFQKPFGVIGFNLLLGVFYFVVSQLSILGKLHPVLSFLYMVLWVYFFVFMNVLIFNYYGKNFGNLSDIGANSIGQDETCT